MIYLFFVNSLVMIMSITFQISTSNYLKKYAPGSIASETGIIPNFCRGCFFSVWFQTQGKILKTDYFSHSVELARS